MTVAPLIRTLPLREGETATSYVSRLAAHHGTVPREFCSDLGLRWPYLCSGRPKQLKRLSQLSGADLKNLTFWSPVKLEIGRYRVGATTSSVGAFRRTSLRVCPICICEALSAEGPQAVFQLLEWCVTCLHGCETHGVALCALPPAPNSHETYDVVGQVLRHRSFIQSSVNRPEPLQPSTFEAYVRARLRSGPQDGWLKPLELAHLHRACMTTGMVVLGCTTRRLADLDRETERLACDAGLEVLSGGPSALNALFDQRRRANGTGRPYFSRDLGQFHDWLRTMKAEPALDGLKNAVRDYVFRNYPVKPDQTVLGARPMAVRRITFDEARQRAGLGVNFLKRLLGHLEGIGPKEAQALTEITLGELDRVLRFRAELCNLTDAGQLLGIRPEQVKALIGQGVLPGLRFGSALRYTRRVAVDDLLTSITQLPEASPHDMTMPLGVFCAARSVSLARVVEAWQEGELEGQVTRAAGQGLQALHLCTEAECTTTRAAPAEAFTLDAAARYLRISLSSIRKLRDGGLLEQQVRRNADTNFEKAFISLTSLERFQRCHVTLGQLAARHKVKPMHLARMLDHAGIPMLECRGVGIRVYAREMLSAHVVYGQGEELCPE